MLAIRYLRSGRANKAFFRIVLTENSRPPKSGFLEILGWYDPHSKKSSLNKEEILKWLDKGAIASNSVSKLLIANKIEHKAAKFIADAPKAKKGKEAVKKAPATVQTEKVEGAEEAAPEETPVVEEAQEKPQKTVSEVNGEPKAHTETEPTDNLKEEN